MKTLTFLLCLILSGSALAQTKVIRLTPPAGDGGMALYQQMEQNRQLKKINRNLERQNQLMQPPRQTEKIGNMTIERYSGGKSRICQTIGDMTFCN